MRLLIAVVVSAGAILAVPPLAGPPASAATYGVVHGFGDIGTDPQPPRLNEPMVGMASAKVDRLLVAKLITTRATK